MNSSKKIVLSGSLICSSIVLIVLTVMTLIFNLVLIYPILYIYLGAFWTVNLTVFVCSKITRTRYRKRLISFSFGLIAFIIILFHLFLPEVHYKFTSQPRPDNTNILINPSPYELLIEEYVHESQYNISFYQTKWKIFKHQFQIEKNRSSLITPVKDNNYTIFWLEPNLAQIAIQYDDELWTLAILLE